MAFWQYGGSRLRKGDEISSSMVVFCTRSTFSFCQILISNWFPHTPFARHSDLEKGDLCDQTKLRSTGGEGGHTTGMRRGVGRGVRQQERIMHRLTTGELPKETLRSLFLYSDLRRSAHLLSRENNHEGLFPSSFLPRGSAHPTAQVLRYLLPHSLAHSNGKTSLPLRAEKVHYRGLWCA